MWWIICRKINQKFKLRHSNHKVEIRNQRGGLRHYFGGVNCCGYQNVRLQIIDQLEKGDKMGLENCEVDWQNQMMCYVENGFGGHCYRMEKVKTNSQENCFLYGMGDGTVLYLFVISVFALVVI